MSQHEACTVTTVLGRPLNLTANSPTDERFTNDKNTLRLATLISQFSVLSTDVITSRQLNNLHHLYSVRSQPVHRKNGVRRTVSCCLYGMLHTGDRNLVYKRDLVCLCVCVCVWGGGRQVYLFFETKSQGHENFTEEWLHTAITGYLCGAYDV